MNVNKCISINPSIRRPFLTSATFYVHTYFQMLRNEGPFPIRDTVASLVQYRKKVRPDIFKDALGVLVL